MQRFDTRYIAITGLLIFAYSCFMNTAMSPDYAGDQLWIPNIVRAIGQAMVLTPLTSVTTGGIAPQDAAAASGISNMLRNLGGAIGTAVLATVITKREQFHSNIIGQSVTLGREEVRNRIAQMTDYFMAHGVPDPAAAHQQAIIALGKAVKHQALVMGFSDTFAVIGAVLVLCRHRRACSRARRKAAAVRRIEIGNSAAQRLNSRYSQMKSTIKANFVMPGLVLGIHVFATLKKRKTWMAGTSPAMTKREDTRSPGGNDVVQPPATGGVPWVWNDSMVLSPQAWPFLRSSSVQTIGFQSGARIRRAPALATSTRLPPGS